MVASGSRGDGVMGSETMGIEGIKDGWEKEVGTCHG
jgi:hypothetical protein